MRVKILDESQKQRDGELSELTGASLVEIEQLGIATPSSLCLYVGKEEPKTKNQIESIYKDYKYCDLTAYLRTLMFTSVHRRHPNLILLLKTTHNEKCLDYGSGVGTHAIALAENECEVTILDIEGPLLRFAKKRIQHRGHKFRILNSNESLPINEFDVVICTDVLEHVFDPMLELKRIHRSMKAGGILHLVVAEKPKQSGEHFKDAIDCWIKRGKPFMKQHYVMLKNTIYRKR